jgi:hypothetical protein
MTKLIRALLQLFTVQAPKMDVWDRRFTKIFPPTERELRSAAMYFNVNHTLQRRDYYNNRSYSIDTGNLQSQAFHPVESIQSTATQRTTAATTAWTGVLEKVIAAHFVKKLTASYKTSKFTIVFTRARYCFLL